MPFKNLKFIYSWRSYQERFLKNIDNHIKDNHLHVVAPPGSGKTILGIEIIRQIGKKTLVLTPTLTIRNQWESRLQSFFLKNESFDDFSFDLNNPKAITTPVPQLIFMCVLFSVSCSCKFEVISIALANK